MKKTLIVFLLLNYGTNCFGQVDKPVNESPNNINLESPTTISSEEELKKSVACFQELVSSIVVPSFTLDENKIRGILSDSKRAIDLIFLKKVTENFIVSLPNEILDADWPNNKSQYILRIQKTETFTYLNNVFLDLEKRIQVTYKRKEWESTGKKNWIKNYMN